MCLQCIMNTENSPFAAVFSLFRPAYVVLGMVMNDYARPRLSLPRRSARPAEFNAIREKNSRARHNRNPGSRPVALAQGPAGWTYRHLPRGTRNQGLAGFCESGELLAG